MIILHVKSEYWWLYQKVARSIFGYKKLLLSYSGGLDSTVLLDILTELKNNFCYLKLSPFIFRAIYIHHGLHKNADAWAVHCCQQCKIRNIPFQIIYINFKILNKKNKLGNIEASARYFRYKQLSEHLKSEEILLTAHHLDDQVETLFLALKRGSGPTGLASMNKFCIFNYEKKCKLLRPLLECTRVQLEKYAYYKKLNWIEDDTNMDIRFDRNFLRIQVMPLLYKRWSNFNQVVSRTIQLCRNQENLLNELLSEYLEKLVGSDDSLLFEPLLKCSTLKRQALLRLWLSKFFIIMPSYQLLQRIWDEVALSKPDSTPILKLGKYYCCRYRKKLYLLPRRMISSINKIKLFWNPIYNIIILPNNLGILQYTKLNIYRYTFPDLSKKSYNNLLKFYHIFFGQHGKILTQCFVRVPKPDEKISVCFGMCISKPLTIIDRCRRRCLKKIWQELNIPTWLRSRIPLLFYNDTLIAAIGAFITQDGQVLINSNQSSNTSWKIVWIQDTESYRLFFSNIKKFFTFRVIK